MDSENQGSHSLPHVSYRIMNTRINSMGLCFTNSCNQFDCSNRPSPARDWRFKEVSRNEPLMTEISSGSNIGQYKQVPSGDNRMVKLEREIENKALFRTLKEIKASKSHTD